MKKGISLSGGYDDTGTYTVTIKKRRGKLTLDEIEDAIRDAGIDYYGYYALLLNLNEGALEGPCYWYGDPPGDSVVLYRIEDGENCPVCQKVTPLLTYCPHCGEKLNVTALDIPSEGKENDYAQLT